MAAKEIQKTKSESLFEDFCARRGIKCERIECGPGKTPDYDIWLSGNKIVAEVKQFETTDKDLAWIAAGGGWSKPGKRVQPKFTAARAQLKHRSQGKLPTLLVLYDNGTAEGIDGIDIKTAMYGDEVADIRRDASGRSWVSPIHPSRERKFRPNQNTSISALGLLFVFGGECRLSLYHNCFARVPIIPSWYQDDCFRHFTINSVDASASYDWREVPTATSKEGQ